MSIFMPTHNVPIGHDRFIHSITHNPFHCFSQPRLFSGVLTALVAGSITHACLAPIFATSRLPVATAALDFLAYAAAAVGMCFGVLLPLVFPGACFGAILAVLIGFFEPFFTVQYMMYIYPTLVVIGALVGLK